MNEYEFCPVQLYFNCQISMVTPKANNDHLFPQISRISPSRNLFVRRAQEIHGLDHNYMNFESF